MLFRSRAHHSHAAAPRASPASTRCHPPATIQRRRTLRSHEPLRLRVGKSSVGGVRCSRPVRPPVRLRQNLGTAAAPDGPSCSHAHPALVLSQPVEAFDSGRPRRMNGRSLHSIPENLFGYGNTTVLFPFNSTRSSRCRRSPGPARSARPPDRPAAGRRPNRRRRCAGRPAR